MYTRVESRFWQDEKMRAVSDDARHLMLYLLTSPHRNIIGLYFLPSPYACFDLGWSEERFKKGLHELLRVGCVKYDENTHVVIVQNYLKHNPLENPNQVKSAIEKLDEIPQTPLFNDFLAIIEKFDKPFMKPLVERLQERLSQPGTGTGTGSGSGDIDNSPNPPVSDEPHEPGEVVNSDAKTVFEHWNSKDIIQHRKLTDKIKRAINGVLKNYSAGEVCAAIDNYAVILKDDRYYWSYKWTLQEFLQRGLEKFLDFETAAQNYLKDKAKPRDHPEPPSIPQNVANALRLVEKYSREEGDTS